MASTISPARRVSRHDMGFFHHYGVYQEVRHVAVVIGVYVGTFWGLPYAFTIAYR